MSKSGGVFQIDDVTRTMSKGGGAPGVPPIQVQTPPPPGWLATGLGCQGTAGQEDDIDEKVVTCRAGWDQLPAPSYPHSDILTREGNHQVKEDIIYVT